MFVRLYDKYSANLLGNCQTLSPSGKMVRFSFSPAIYKGNNFSTILSTLGMVSLLVLAALLVIYGYLIILIHIYRNISNIDILSMCLYAFHLCFFMKYLFKLLSIFSLLLADFMDILFQKKHYSTENTMANKNLSPNDIFMALIIRSHRVEV